MTDFLLAEDGDTLITESGDSLVTEEALLQYEVGGMDEETALLNATAAKLIANVSDLNALNCTVELDDQFLADITNARVGAMLISRGWKKIQDHDSGNVYARQYAMRIFCWIRCGEIPRDRRRNQLIDINRRTLNRFVALVEQVVDWSYDVINDATTLLSDNGDEDQGFQYPFQVQNVDPRITLLPPEFFAGSSGSGVVGIGRGLNLDGAYRKRIRLETVNVNA